MIRAYIDTNVLLNVWFKEVDPKSGKRLWESFLRVLELVEKLQIEGIVSIFTVMESLQVFLRKRGMKILSKKQAQSSKP